MSIDLLYTNVYKPKQKRLTVNVHYIIIKTMQYPESSQLLSGEERPCREPNTVEETREYLLYLQQQDPFGLGRWIRETLLMFNQAPANRMEEALQKPANLTGNEGLELERYLSKIRDTVEEIRRGTKRTGGGETPTAEVSLLPVIHRQFLNRPDRMP